MSDLVRNTKDRFSRITAGILLSSQVVIEAASGAAVAAAMSDKMRSLDSTIQSVGVILCGGNVDIDHLPWYKT